MLLSQIAEILNGQLIGDPNCDITGIAKIQDANPGQISIISEKKYLPLANATKASALIVFQKLDAPVNQILINNTKKALADTIKLFHPDKPLSAHISDKAHIEKTAIIAKNCEIAPFVLIDQQSQIGENTRLLSGVKIGKNCKIGTNCALYPNVVISDDCIIGNNVIIHAGSVIGSDGFGFLPKAECWDKIPQVGNVVIEDNVEIGANTCIDRGCLGSTLIKKGTKLDNLIHIAHNCEIGQNCAITAQVGLSGGVILADHVMIAGQAGLNGHIYIGQNTTILGKSGVTKDIPANAVISGYPAKSHAKVLKEQAILNKLIKYEIERKEPTQ